MKVLCSVFKSTRRDAMYLYVDKTQGLSRVPKALLESFGKPVHTLTFLLQPGRKLAVEDADKVMANIRDRGFHLQLPPGREHPQAILQAALAAGNSKAR